MVTRLFWLDRVNSLLSRRSVLWLTGVRRVGKTFLSKMVDGEYFDCELVQTRQELASPEPFLRNLKGKTIVLDEIHRLPNPTELLKIAADHYQDVKIIATGSSRLQASTKFRDTLTGRKYELWLTPMNSRDLADFGNPDFNHRLLHGGLPPLFLSKKVSGLDVQEWVDSYWAKDIHELFRLELFDVFQRFLELLSINSGGIFEATYYSERCEASRSTIRNYLGVLESTFVAHVVKPFSSRRSNEIVSAPKVYVFDTGFVSYVRNWDKLRAEDKGVLWEHLVLNEIHSIVGSQQVRYWRDKRGHEIDFVLVQRGRVKAPISLECKWSINSYNARNLRIFRRKYSEGPNWVVCADVDRAFPRQVDGLEVTFMGLDDFHKAVKALGEAPFTKV